MYCRRVPLHPQASPARSQSHLLQLSVCASSVSVRQASAAWSASGSPSGCQPHQSHCCPEKPSWADWLGASESSRAFGEANEVWEIPCASIADGSLLGWRSAWSLVHHPTADLTSLSSLWWSRARPPQPRRSYDFLSWTIECACWGRCGCFWEATCLGSMCSSCSILPENSSAHCIQYGCLSSLRGIHHQIWVD